MAELKELSVFFPAYNEADNIDKTVKDAVEVLEDWDVEYEIIVVDDGSTDQTAEIVEALHDKNPRIKLVQHQENKGYGGALKTGMKHAQYQWVCYTDSDGQFDFSQLEKFIKYKNDNDLIIGYREKRTDSLFRRFVANVLLRAWNFVLYGVWFKDIDCGFKLFKKEVVDQVGPALITESAITETEFIVRAKRSGYRIREVPVTHYSRAEGIQTGGNLKVIYGAVAEGLKLFFQLLKESLFTAEGFVFLAILLLGAFLRFFKLRAYMTFLGDQGRDVLVVWKMLKQGDLTFLGPVASMGGFYLGPIYYYLMTPFLFLFNYDPIGPVVMVVFFDLLTIYLIYKYGKEFISNRVGLLSAFLYSISSLAVTYSRFSWNPNVLPFFSLLLFYTVTKEIIANEKIYYFIAGLSLGIIVQLHYMAVLLFPFLLLSYLFLEKKKQAVDFIYGIGGFLITFSPFLLFEIKHGFPNFTTIFNFVLRGKEVGLLTGGTEQVKNTFTSIGTQLFGGMLAPEKIFLGKTLFYLSLLGLFLEFVKKRLLKRKTLFVFAFLTAMIFIASIYKRAIYDHYLTFLFFLPPLMFSVFFFKIIDKKKLLYIPGAVLLFFLLKPNYQNFYFHKEPNHQVDQVERVTEMIIDGAEHDQFNFALATPGNSDHAYRYYLAFKNHPPVKIEDRIEEELMIVCEKECDPLATSLWEVRAFGDAKIVGEWKAKGGIYIYRAVHTQKSASLIGKPAKK
jgi:glycosyltransferase involved in cell wall biosynthesis